MLSRAIEDEIEVSRDSVRGSLKPFGLMNAHEGGHHLEDAVATIEIPPFPASNVAEQRSGKILDEDSRLDDARVHQVGKNKITDPVMPRELERRLGAVEHKRSVSACVASGKNQR